MARTKSIAVRSVIKSLFSDAWLRKTSRETGFIKRQRKIEPVTFFWTLVLGFGSGLEWSVASFRRAYEQASGVKLAPSSYYDRFNAQLVGFLKCAMEAAFESFAAASADVHARLKCVKDLMLIDSTVVRLHPLLEDVFPGSRTNTSPATVKLRAILSVRGKGRSTVGIFSERTPEQETVSVGEWVLGRLLLFDKGYFSYPLFDKIASAGGYFLTRLKNHCNPTIVEVRGVSRRRSNALKGKQLKDIKADLNGETLDAVVGVTYRRLRKYGWDRRSSAQYRLIGLFDKEEGQYHFYLTNLAADRLDAKDAYNIYRVRWEIELIFRELKSGYGLGHIDSTRQHVVEALLYSAVITLIASRRLLRAVAPQLKSRGERATGSRWWRLFATYSHTILLAVCTESRETPATRRLAQLLVHEMVDPHTKRKSLLNQDCRETSTRKRRRTGSVA